MRTMILIILVFGSYSLWAGRAGFSVLVLDSETSDPIKGVKIEGSFLNYSKSWGVAARDNDVDAYTDANGMARLSGNTESGKGGYRIYGNEGYYNAEWREIRFSEQSLLRLGAWVPSNIISTARLDRVLNPIPLYVKKVKGKFREKKQGDYMIATDYKNLQKALLSTNDVRRVSNVTMAFDVVVGDWLPPLGGGNVSDISFVFNEDVLGWKVAEGYSVSISKLYKMNLLVSFLGKGNGIVEIPVDNRAGIKIRNAPLEGYSSNLSRWKGWLGGGATTDCDKDRCYVFRIRTEYDDEGNFKSALYGKIYGDFDMLDIEGVRFLYYLNPTPNDRNLEWDRKHNLCPKPGDIGYPKP